jgi:serpin B
MGSLLKELPVDEDVVFSPLSVRTALAMLLPGARGETRDQIAQFVGTSDPVGLARLVDGLQRMHADKVRLSIANGAFVQRGYPIRDAYRRAVEDPFRALIEELDFSNSPAAVSRINKWVERETEGMIQNLLSPQLMEPGGLVLVNAIYFLATWATPFSEELTRRARFRPLTGRAQRVPMMQQRLSIPYVADEKRGLEAVRIPYKALSLVVVLPRRGSFEKVARSFGEEEVAGLAALRWPREEVDLRLPRFEIEKRLSLRDLLIHLGVRSAFDAKQADFGALTDHLEGLYLSAVQHAARIRVDERGTEAAAATAASMGPTMPGGRQRRAIKFHVDRPFLFFVEDHKSKTVLFAGRCTSPAQAGSRS